MLGGGKVTRMPLLAASGTLGDRFWRGAGVADRAGLENRVKSQKYPLFNAPALTGRLSPQILPPLYASPLQAAAAVQSADSPPSFRPLSCPTCFGRLGSVPNARTVSLGRTWA